MKPYKVSFAPEAIELVEQVRVWWIANRPANPVLFDDELAAACRRLATTPHAGELYSHPRILGVHRVLMPRTRYHLYFLVDDAAVKVWILAVWHAARGQRPPI